MHHNYNGTLITDVEHIREASENLRDFAQSIGGYKVAACDNIASKKPMVDADDNILATTVFGWTEKADTWWKKPFLALNSPVTRACRYESEAFWLNTERFYSRQPNKFLEEINLSKIEDIIGSKALICVPAHLPFSQIGAVSFSHPDVEKQDLKEDFQKYGFELEHLAKRYLAGYAKAMNRRVWIPKDCKLSKREVECVKWAAIGKTDKEIAMILSRSCATIRFHIHNAAVKLNAVNRCQTVFKASQLGYLGAAAT